ncbi:MAG: DNA repair exonuclease SbcCD ATPase subunit [Candidatus Nanohaloarchaea archaeon]|jgi:DNA repair exonuclease SbcCD ATPase subunit
MFKPLKPLFEPVKLPWKLKDDLEQKEEKIEQLEEKIKELEEEKDSWKERFEAEKERRSKLSTKKQEAEEDRNRLKEKLQGEAKSEDKAEEEEKSSEFENLSFEEAQNTLQKIGSISSGEEDLVTVYSPEKMEDISNLRELKNSIPKEQYSQLQDIESFVAFYDPVLGVFVLRMNPFFPDKVSVEKSFEVGEILDFIEKEKYWCVVSAGETEIFREQNGEFEQVERIKNRVDREHSKGGFSQGRFERKREEQIDQHVEQVSEVLEEYSDIYLIGDRKLCKKLDGKYLGGFDPNRKKPEQFYGFRFRTFF